MLGRGGKDTSAPWENPTTGARGTVTPIATSYTQDGRVCRDFLASYVKPGTESWLQGEACRVQPGNWEVRTLKPWKRVRPGLISRFRNRRRIAQFSICPHISMQIRGLAGRGSREPR